MNADDVQKIQDELAQIKPIIADSCFAAVGRRYISEDKDEGEREMLLINSIYHDDSGAPHVIMAPIELDKIDDFIRDISAYKAMLLEHQRKRFVSPEDEDLPQ